MPGISKSFYKAEPGQIVLSNGRRYRITHLLSVDCVLAVDLETQESRRLRIETVTQVTSPDTNNTNTPTPRDLTAYSNEEWAIAQRRFLAIKPLLDNPVRTRGDAETIARKAGVHVATLYQWLRLYLHAGHVSALVPEKRGRKTGTRLLESTQETIIQSVFDDKDVYKQRPKQKDIIEEVKRRCRLAKIAPPHENTVRNRIADIHPAKRLRGSGRPDVARNKFEAIQSEYPDANQPLSVVQIDHTEADIILVDEATRKPVGRPWLTLAIEVFTRMIVGLYLSFERPSAASVGLCLAQAICPKREYLAELGISGEWPVWGVMSVVYSDNGKEFRGNVLQRACEEYNIDLQWRPGGLPHFGGHIERLMGTSANEIRKLPGTTFSNPAQRHGYDSEANSALTLKEFEQHLVDFIVNVYHKRVHSELGMPPVKKWELGILGTADTPGIGILPIPEDPLRVRLDFMPFFETTVQRYGIQIDNIQYYDSVLDSYINAPDPDNPKNKHKFLVRRDPRDISKVYFLDPADNRYVEVPYRNRGYPAMSIWELREIRRELKERGARDVDEHLIFEALERMRARVEAAKHKTKAARRKATRIPPQHKPLPKNEPTQPPVVPRDRATSIDDDPFSEPALPFDEISLNR